MDKNIKIIDCKEIKVPFDLKIGEEEIHNTIIHGTLGSGGDNKIYKLDNIVNHC